MIDLDIDDVFEFHDRVSEEFRQIPKMLRQAVRFGAQYERDNHEYKNRTRNLQRNTKGVIDESSRHEVVASITMGTEYASYVVNRGLSEIEDAAAHTEQILDGAFEALEERTSK